MSRTQRGPNDREEPILVTALLRGYIPAPLEVEAPSLPTPEQIESLLDPPEPTQPQPTEGEETLTDE